MGAKDKVRKLFNFLHLDVTKNLKYDRLTQRIIREELKPNSNCIDVGCHKGEILDIIVHNAPKGKHFAFEPIPSFYESLKNTFGKKVEIHPFALSKEEGSTHFHYVKNAPAYSGINKRSYKVKSPEIQKLEVEKKTLDSIIPESIHIDFIKIDVEGGEFDVLQGSERVLREDHPLLVFEFGNGASEYYQADPEAFYTFLSKFKYGIYTLDKYVSKKNPLTQKEFEKIYREGTDYYFVAN